MHNRQPSATAWSQITPFMLPARIPTTQTTPWGPGVLVPVTAAANSPVTVTHGLARRPQIVKCMANNGGATLEPRLTWSATLQTITITGDQNMTNALVWVI